VVPSLKGGRYRLDFGGLVRVPSSKNFILGGVGSSSGHAMLFGCVGTDRFIL
jgi:hypothetical protein